MFWKKKEEPQQHIIDKCTRPGCLKTKEQHPGSEYFGIKGCTIFLERRTDVP